MNQTIEILKALVTLVNQAVFNCDAEGAEKIAAIRQTAVREVQRLEAEANEIEGDENE